MADHAVHRKSSNLPAGIKARLVELGRAITTEPCAEMFAPLQPADALAGIRVARDVRYGPAGRNRLDVFEPQRDEGRKLPVLLFVHGGGYVAGDKHVEGSPFYSNVGAWAARNGFVGVNMTYRLAREAPWPAAQEDIAAALRWLAAHAADHGGDPSKIFLVAHSAGATHAAAYLAHPEFHAAHGAPGVAGAILVSGSYDFGRLKASANFLAYYGDRHAERSPLAGLARTQVPVLLAAAELDPPDTVAQMDAAGAAFAASGRPARCVLLEDHSHISEIYAMNTGDEALGAEIVAFVGGASASS